MKSNLKLGEMLLYAGKINSSQLQEAVEEQKHSTKKIGEILVEKGYLTQNDIIESLEYQLGFPRVDLNKYELREDIITLIPESLARKYKAIAIDKKGNTLIVAMVDPLNFFGIDDIKLYSKMEIETVMATNNEIQSVIEKYYSKESAKKALEEFEDSSLSFIDADDLEEDEILEVTSAPVVRLVNSIVEQAVKNRASDIHIEPYADSIRVRFRVDGDLIEIMKLPRNNLSPIVTRIKIIGEMNIAEKRLPQDGRVESVINGNEIDMRISSLPTVYGEKIVIRLLDKSDFIFTKENLGFSQKNLDILDSILRQPYGMILVTGPTGSGKTTTLYAILKELNVSSKNIITVEDPVEYKLKGINQVQVNQKAGLTFVTGLRSILRQDPDTIMIGEIRDAETAEISVRAAITGHLVLSTLHTNDSPSTISRLVDMGIEPYLVSSAIIGIASQRLVKVLCNECKEEHKLDYLQKQILGIDVNDEVTMYKPVGCNVCNGGYKGRLAIHEIMSVDEGLRKLVDTSANIDQVRKYAIDKGMTTLLEAAKDVALEGKTSYEEVIRVGYTLG